MIRAYCVQGPWLKGATRKYCSGETDIVSSKTAPEPLALELVFEPLKLGARWFLHFVCC